MAIKPPKCKTCGAEEWRHTCGPNPKIMALLEQRIAEAENSQTIRDFKQKFTDDIMNHGTAIPMKPSRKEYLKLKARERRARQKAKK